MTLLNPLPESIGLSAAKLSAGVGVGKQNLPRDVQLVRDWLNAAIDGMFLIPLARLEDGAQFDDRVKFALHQVERRYFFGMALPKSGIDPGSSLESFLRDIASNCLSREVKARLSAEMYGLAAIMVPGGADHRTRVKTAAGIKFDIQSGNIRKYLPEILKALDNQSMADLVMVMMSFGTIRAETWAFAPVDEGISNYNTTLPLTKNGHTFDKYDNKDELGNTGAPDGADFKGRGFIQLTGRINYQKIGDAINKDLVDNPASADDPKIAAEILAQ